MTIGDLIASLHDSFEREYHDPELAAIATEVTLNDLLRAAEMRARATARPQQVRRAA